ncbi:hypothetical protein PHMEG_00017770 [Phytophthora megakarya]|uniref:BED-type domain-containing protein n=1 Tax=Phytophthora megakarya TaxID=4795 RepID=A0A225VY51_9STRA|nr:hypothetical protein PHMEG_00017770 [Phytophthora megakarya]
MSESLSAPQRPDCKFTPKQIAAFYFKPSLAEDGDPTGLQICQACGKARKHTPKTGYTNLESHVKSDHPRFEMEMGDDSVDATGSLLPWVRQKASNRYAWLEWVVNGNLPDSFVEMEYTKLPPVCRNTLRANMEAVTKAVEKRIGEEMPNKFGLLLDGWSHGTDHYLGVFACYVTPYGPQYPLLSLTPIVVDAAGWFNAETHMAALAAFRSFLRLARLMVVLLVGCANHRLNLAVRTLLEPHEAEMEQVQSLMKRLRTLKASLRPKLRQETRWGSSFAMLARYFERREYIGADDEDLAKLMPSPAANRRMKALLVELADVESVSMKLQCDDLNLLDTRDLLDGLFDDIVAALELENGVVKILGGRVKQLSRAEKAALKPFEREASAAAAATEETTKVAFPDRILKRRKVQDNASAYLEMLLFPKVDSKYWDVTTVDAVI